MTVFGCQFREHSAEFAQRSEADEPIEGKHLSKKSSTLTWVSVISTAVQSYIPTHALTKQDVKATLKCCLFALNLLLIFDGDRIFTCL